MRFLILCLTLWVANLSAAFAQEAEVIVVEDRCPVPLPAGAWSEWEQLFWDDVCLGDGDTVNLQWWDSEEDLPCRPDLITGEVPANRRIKAELIAAMATSEALVKHMGRKRIGLKCAEITGQLDLSYSHVEAALALEDSYFPSWINLTEARFDKTLSFDRSRLEHGLTGNLMDVGGSLRFRGSELAADLRLSFADVAENLDMRGSDHSGEFYGDGMNVSGWGDFSEKAKFAKTVYLLDAGFGRGFTASTSTFEGLFNAARIKVGGGLFLQGGAKFQGVELGGADVLGEVSAIGSTFEGLFSADRLKVGGSLFLRGGANFQGVVLLGADVSSNVEADGSTFEGLFSADNLKVGGSLFLRNGAKFQGVDLRGADVSSNVEADGSTFEGLFSADHFKVGGSLFLRGGAKFQGVVLRSADVAGNVEADGSTFEGKLELDSIEIGDSLFLRDGSAFQDVNLIGANITGHLQLGASTFSKKLDLTNVLVRGEILVSSANHGHPEWGSEAHLILRNTDAGALQAGIRAWQRADGTWVSTDLSGFSYSRLGGLNAEEEGAGNNMGFAPAKDLIAWIENTQTDHDARYDPSPYQQLALTLSNAGQEQEAKRVRYAQMEHKRRAEDTGAWGKVALGLSKVFIGHGVYPFVLVGWFAVLVAIGVWVAKGSSHSDLRSFGQRFWYSLENALPLVELKDKHKAIAHGNGLREGFFHFQKVAGFLMATVLVGALTLLGG